MNNTTFVLCSICVLIYFALNFFNYYSEKVDRTDIRLPLKTFSTENLKGVLFP